jgi:predicted RNA-binding protein Jag
VSERRFFWGRTLPQAIAKAARHYGVAPESLAWSRHEKRHGFVRHQRAVLVEVDPRAPLRAVGSELSGRSGTAPAAEAAPKPGAAPAPRRVAAPSPPAVRPATPRPTADKIVARRNETEWDAPDEESEAAALEACRRLLRFARIAAVPAATRHAERIEIELTPPGPDTAAEAIGDQLLDDLEHLLPRAVFTLCGRRVRVAVDAFGRRAARAEELRALAAAVGERVRASGEAETLEPMTPGERRTVHLVFESDPELATESLGDSHRKRVRISRRT